jgi:hypothetical protein
MGTIKEFKKSYLNYMSTVNSFRNSWGVWEPIIQSKLSTPPTGVEIFNLGDSLSEIFTANSTSGRSQGSLSGGGTAWECLVCWYLNLILWETPVIAVRQKRDYIPEVISNCVTVTIGCNRTNTESDIVIYSIPSSNSLKSINNLNTHIQNNLNAVDMVVLQCKTNWNDNAQIPMLWDMIYNSNSRLPHVSVGVEGVSPLSVNKFKYAFVTVPSNTRSTHTSTNISVLRVRGLTGGNYWGKRTESDVAASIKELPNRHFGLFLSGGVVGHVNQLLMNDDYLDSFLSIEW